MHRNVNDYLEHKPASRLSLKTMTMVLLTMAMAMAMAMATATATATATAMAMAMLEMDERGKSWIRTRCKLSCFNVLRLSS